MNRVVAIALKEVRGFLQDRADLVFSLFLPVAVFALMYGAFSGQTMFNGTAYVVNDNPGGIYSQRLVERLGEKEELEVELLSRDEAETKLANSDISLYTYIPPDFSTQLASGWPTSLTLRQRGNGGTEGQIVAGFVRGEADRVSQEMQIERQVMSAMAGKGVSREQIETTVRGLLEREDELPTVAVIETPVGGEFNPVRQFLPGIVTMFVLLSVTLGSRAIVEERSKGTLERLLTTRLSVAELYAGKFLAGTARGFVQTLILLGLAYAVFDLFTPLTFVSALFVALVFSAAASTLGLIIASIARTEDQAVSMSVFFTMATVMLGGTFFEISEDSVLYLIGRASINTYVNSAFQTMTVPESRLGDVSLELAVLASVVVSGLILSRALFRAIPGGR